MAATNKFHAGTELAKRIPKVQNYQPDIVIGGYALSVNGMSNNVWLGYNLSSVILLMKAL